MRFQLTILVAAFTLSLGCGAKSEVKMGTVSGKVTLDGAPLPDASIFSQPEFGRPSYGTTASDGSYSLKYSDSTTGAAIGQHRVSIRTGIEGSPDGGKGVPEKLPAKYHDRSELTMEVKQGKNTHDFELKSK